MNFKKHICVMTLIVAAGGCSAESGGDSAFTHLTLLNDQQFAVHTQNGPDAIVSSAGDLSINGKTLMLSQSQKDLAIRYFANASALRKDGFATGMAGASTAMTAINSVVNGLTSGNPEKIGAEVDAKAAKIENHVEKLCGDLRELASTQNALAVSLPDFRPYALIDAKTVDGCHAG